MPGVFRVQESEEINFGIFVDRKKNKSTLSGNPALCQHCLLMQ